MRPMDGLYRRGRRAASSVGPGRLVVRSSPEMRPIVALLTDFGSQDHYVGALRGAVLSACREAAVVDLTHDLPPHDVMAAAFSLAAARSAFPAGTTFLAVVDPGVG